MSSTVLWRIAWTIHRKRQRWSFTIRHYRSIFLLILFFFFPPIQTLSFNELLTLLIPNICWTLAVHDGIKPIRQHHPWAGDLLALKHVWNSSAQALSANLLPNGSCTSPPLSPRWSAQPFVIVTVALIKEAIDGGSAPCIRVSTVRQRSLTAESHHLKAAICIF